MKIQQLYELTNDENRFLLFETASNRYLIAFSQTPFFEIKIKKAPPMGLGFLALISGKVELKRVQSLTLWFIRGLKRAKFPKDRKRYLRK